MNVSVEDMATLLEKAHENSQSFDTVLTQTVSTNTAVYGHSMPKMAPDHDETLQLQSSIFVKDTSLSISSHYDRLKEAGNTAVDLLCKKQIFGIYIAIKS